MSEGWLFRRERRGVGRRRGGGGGRGGRLRGALWMEGVAVAWPVQRGGFFFPMLVFSSCWIWIGELRRVDS